MQIALKLKCRIVDYNPVLYEKEGENGIKRYYNVIKN
jgi:hypothetical protein